MKRILFYLLPVVAVAALSAGCGGEQKWDYPNVEISITLEDSNGTDLLKRQSPVFDNTISVEYNGKTYRLSGPTRADGPVLPEMKGLRWRGSMFTTVPNQLLFGEFAIDTKQYHRESFTIDWGDGTRNEIEFDLYSTSNGKKGQPTLHQATWLDGVENSPNTLTVRIVRE